MSCLSKFERFCYLSLSLAISGLIGPYDVMADNKIRIETIPFTENVVCSGHFVAHDLDHTTTVMGGDRIRMFEANGGGVAVNDLDNDGDLDIVLTNQAGMNTILWNDGGLKFRTERMAHGDSRAVTLVDVDGDGLSDMVFTRTKTAPTYWHNEGKGRFLREFLPGVGKPVYAINWGDLDQDGDLDLVGATYDASLLTDYGQDFLLSGNGGVYYYENRGGQFHLSSLSTNAQALALMLVDLNDDGHLDIWVGDDFAVPDQLWYWSPSGWQSAKPLTTMTHSTMSLDFGDINNDGKNEVFATDMKPYNGDEQGQAVLPAITKSVNEGRNLKADPQVNENVLQTIGSFTNMAASDDVYATGWSWSGKFGDFDQDGFLDLYVVNGFAEMSTFSQLANHELVEANQALRNTGTGRFVPMPDWGLGSTRGGRGMSIADMDGDGDLDIIVNNLNSPSQLFENQICTGSSLEVDLFAPDTLNTRAIGARVILHTDSGTYYRDVKAASGYISGDAARVHFGFPKGTHLQQLEIHWPNRDVSILDAPSINTLMKITRVG
ncbi:MAG: CRTAC1 family protein [Anaerolineaceae bacterium]|nr:CRTAC1 family protein [Anaerolineaceae bacterium]